MPFVLEKYVLFFQSISQVQKNQPQDGNIFVSAHLTTSFNEELLIRSYCCNYKAQAEHLEVFVFPLWRAKYYF